ncbi:glutamate mutase L [Pseudonocardia acaciae]|uniref:glutamate mutase L n=1 Tax=Pseudonocardia acaciae TaxID=551276 RepID=UPI00056421E3|nr:glutamate mutase L [Pseudonocardia acaciae]
MTARPSVCVDVGSGWTKALGIDPDGEPTGCAQHPTTPHDLLEGVHAAAAAVGVEGPLTPRRAASDAELLACSSAGGGLRLAVVGQERLASEEAGRRAGCSAGARVVNVQAGLLEPAGVRALRSARPDVVLLVDGVGTEAEQTVLRNAARLARARVRAPIVLAVRAGVRSDAMAVLRATGRTVLATDAVFPAEGEIVPEPARVAMSELLAGHLVGGRGTATTARFRRLAKETTPAAVCRGLAELVRARGAGGGAVLVVDVGSSTTDVYSALPAASADDVSIKGTAEADLGMRPTVTGILTEGQAEGVVDPVEADLLGPTARRLAEETDFLPTDAGGRAEDRRLAALASVLAVRRHLRVAGAELAEAGVGLVLLTGGVFRQPDQAGLAAIRMTLRCDEGLRGMIGDAPVAVDDGYALAPAGLLAARGRAKAARTVLDAAIAPDQT